MAAHDQESRLKALEDRADLKALVDTFSNLADQKNVGAQVLLLTEDATVDSYVDGNLVSSLKGREQIASAFSGFLAQFDTVCHQNGQQTVELNGDRAAGSSYCTVVLIGAGAHGGQRTRNTSGVIYADQYERRNGRWLIASRISRFVWTDVQSVTSGSLAPENEQNRRTP
jgi:hypothetical protein